MPLVPLPLWPVVALHAEPLPTGFDVEEEEADVEPDDPRTLVPPLASVFGVFDELFEFLSFRRLYNIKLCFMNVKQYIFLVLF